VAKKVVIDEDWSSRVVDVNAAIHDQEQSRLDVFPKIKRRGPDGPEDPK
jgi:hypothetical protein